MRLLVGAAAVCLMWGQNEPAPAPAPAKEEGAAPAAGAPATDEAAKTQRTQLNLAGQTDSSAGESRRNENVQFNLIDTATAKELMVRLGTSATINSEFLADRSYFGGAFGARPAPGIHLPPRKSAGIHGTLNYAHMNSVTSARSFFQVSGVKPARENEYGFSVGNRTWLIEGSQQKIRGNVNGNVLVPRLDERTPLATDPAIARIVARWMAAYPVEAPNRTDIDERALNTNAPQRINTNMWGARLDRALTSKDRLALRYQFTAQSVDAFQLVAGQNPDTDTRSHTARVSWNRAISARTVMDVTLGFDRLGTWIRPEPNAVGPSVNFGNAIAGLGPSPPIPITRAQNNFRAGAQASHATGTHRLAFGADLQRQHTNGLEQDGDRGIITFGGDQERSVITNFRLGRPLQLVQALGNTHRGYRQWFPVAWIHDQWKARPGLDITVGVRYEPAPRPTEVNGLDTYRFGCDCNNFGPRLGLAWRPGGKAGVFRAAYGIHFGTMFATTYGQIRLSPPSSYRLVVNTPDLTNPLRGVDTSNLARQRSGRFVISDDFVVPYEQQYNFSWEPELRGGWKVQLGYVGTRSLKLFQMWFDNRARPVAGIAQTNATINQRRTDPSILEMFRIHNSSRGYFDAGRASLITPRWFGARLELAYWFSKAIDLGNDYTATLSGADARTGRSQYEDDVHQDLKARSSFDQPHALLGRVVWESPRSGHKAFRDWEFNAVLLAKNGTPFSIESGSDAPGLGNSDGQGGDRVHIVDPSILGATVSHPDVSTALLARSRFAFMRPGEVRGNIGRNTFRRARIANVNASLARRIALRGDRVLHVRAESVNFLNTPQFSEPTKELSAPSFGRITNTLNDGRTFRVSARLQF